ncbi:PH domain-containing protein [Flagellimonas sp.]|uniref:PH domain-containing protein n=1 Tax=Flagellimonas sp. TaxID=2058762 RepID=UPI003BA97141
MEEGKLYSNQEGNKVVYPSKVGWELLLPIIIIYGFLIANSFDKDSLLGFTILIGSLIFLVVLFYSISYEVTDEVLTVISFFFIKKNILIKDITRIVESNNPISSPAASLDRLEVYYGKYSSVIISPKDKMGFIAHLKRLSPSIQVELKKKK